MMDNMKRCIHHIRITIGQVCQITNILGRKEHLLGVGVGRPDRILTNSPILGCLMKISCSDRFPKGSTEMTFGHDNGRL